MRFVPLLLLFLVLVSASRADEPLLPPVFRDDFSKGMDRWQPGDPNAWKISEMAGRTGYHQFQQSKVKTPHRSPFNYSFIKGLSVGDFILRAKCLSTGKDGNHRDMCLFFGYQDPAHFYYVHIAKKGDDRAHQIFIVDGKDRVKISKTTTEGVKWDDRWHDVSVVRDVGSGKIEVYFDDLKMPIMTAVDKTFTWGQIGVGSFDDSGLWSDVEVFGIIHKK